VNREYSTAFAGAAKAGVAVCANVRRRLAAAVLSAGARRLCARWSRIARRVARFQAARRI